MAILSVMPAILAGCSKKIWITQYPEFYTAELKNIAVVPFRNRSSVRGAGDVVSDSLAATLMSNGTYKVFNRNHLKSLLDERDLQIAFGSNTSAAAAKFRQLGNVQAILVGAVNTYAATANRQRKRDPVYGYNPQTGASYVSGYRTYEWTRYEANVAVTAALIRVSDGSTIYSTPGPAQANWWAEGSPPKLDAYGCLNNATNNVVSQLLEQFAIVRRQIKVNPAKDFRTASELYDNKWTFTDVFGAADEEMYVVLKLPASCDRNRFRLAVVRKGERKDLVSQQIVWDKQYGSYGYLFRPKEIAAGGGPGQYEVKFYSGQEPVLKHAFRIR